MKFFFHSKRIITVVLGLSLAAQLGLAGFYPQTAVAFSESEIPYAPNEVIATFDRDVTKKEAEQVVDTMGAQEMKTVNTGGEQVTALITLPKEQTVEDTVSTYEEIPEISSVQPNYKYQLTEGAEARRTNDTYYLDLWHFDTLKVEAAWQLIGSVKHEKVKVAVLDTGLDLAHPDLQRNVNRSLCADVSSGVPTPLSSSNLSHGTHVTGIIGATTNNGVGVAGVGSGKDNSVAEVFVVDVFEDDGAYTDDIIAGIAYARENGAKVVNMSLTLSAQFDPATDPLLEKAIQETASKGTAVICAAGNSGNEGLSYPSDYEDSIGVIATDDGNHRWEFSNYGEKKDISAPGVDIYSTDYQPEYGNMDGTSAAAPMVSGVAALLYSVVPNLTTEEVKEILYETATDLGTKGKDNETGYGNVNAYAAVNALVPEKPTKIRVDGKVIRWNLSGRAAPCRLVLYKNGRQIYEKTGISRNLCTLPILKKGSYTVQVTSINERSKLESPAAVYRFEVGKKEDVSKKDKPSAGGSPETSDGGGSMAIPAVLAILSLLVLVRCGTRESR